MIIHGGLIILATIEYNEIHRPNVIELNERDIWAYLLTHFNRDGIKFNVSVHFLADHYPHVQNICS